jgi:hypothetical protein
MLVLEECTDVSHVIYSVTIQNAKIISLSPREL